MGRIILISISFWLAAGCSSRVEYSPTSIVIAAPNAININTATAAEFEKLPHVGPKTAENIVQFREENGSFRRVEHLMQIRGISEKRFIEIRDFLKAE